MASCAACTATRSALLSSSCRAIHSRTITSSASSSTSSTAGAAAAAAKARGPLRPSPPSPASGSCRALSCAASMPASSGSISIVQLHPAASLLAPCQGATANAKASGGTHHHSGAPGFLLASTAALLAASSLNIVAASTPSPIGGATVATTTTAAPVSKPAGDGGGGGAGGGGGGPSTDASAVPAAVAVSTSRAKEDVQRYEDALAKDPYQVSKSAEQGVRWTMEDTYTVANGGHFAAVFDGHGGSGVSGMLRDHVHRLYSKALYQRHGEETQKSALDGMQVDDDEDSEDASPSAPSVPSIDTHIASIRAALKRIEREAMRHDHFEYQGSTAVCVLVSVGKDGERTLVSANVGDSRAILCRGRKAVNLTRDHKPSDEREKARIRSMGEDVQWDPYGEIYRVKDLSLSRAIGDRFAKPVVSSEAEIGCVPVEDEDEFFLLASDGLWDVMTSQEVVDFVHEMLECPTQSVKTKKGKIVLTPEFRRRKMARFVAHEALERGSADNVCVILVWLKKEKK
ncbi:unnamed protein product [Pseudo-nitzschia multistriata]|uniref:PPM-type phosphatase domain-containing protein n=1 Tax=Pseudo-nitzschia multistriata TaxID=183589 RepID=A0A448Z4T2_9STRA|nr:unnamed protein product [Pseudo-nitzschia multistriata]